jgi:sodium-dependent dicarboxylate transporter 2/3/5
MVVALGLMLTPVERGRMALSLRAAGAINWGLLVMLGGGFALAEGVTRSGLSTVLADGIEAIGPVPPLLALFAICLLTTALSEVASNTATASILLPVLAAVAPHLGLSAAVAMFAATLAASFGFMLPAGTPPNAVVFSSGHIPVVDMVKIGFVVDLAGTLIVALICYCLAPWALGLT